MSTHGLPKSPVLTIRSCPTEKWRRPDDQSILHVDDTPEGCEALAKLATYLLELRNEILDKLDPHESVEPPIWFEGDEDYEPINKKRTA